MFESDIYGYQTLASTGMHTRIQTYTYIGTCTHVTPHILIEYHL